MGHITSVERHNLIAIVGSSGSGKTTLIEKLVPVLKGWGLSVSTIKHAHHGFDMDRPGKDSYRHREAGAAEVMVMAGGHWVLQGEEAREPSLQDLVHRMTPVDLILVEGFKSENIPKIEVYRPCVGKPAFYPSDARIFAVATDAPAYVTKRSTLDLNNPVAVAAAVLLLCGHPYASLTDAV